MNWLEELAQINEQLKQHGLSIGCIVVVSYVEFKVTRADFSFKKPWLWGVSKNKNGEWGLKEHCLYSDWELK